MMLRKGFKVLAVLVAVGILTQTAEAGWRHAYRRAYGSSGGSWGGWGSSGGYGGSSGGYYGGSSGGWGSSGGGYYYGGSSGGSWGSSGGGYYGGSSGGSSGGSGGGYHQHPAPAAAPADGAPAPTPPTPPSPSDAGAPMTYHPTYGPLRTSALLTVQVPAGAKVFVNDRPTTSEGTSRDYISHNLNPGARYGYTVRAEFERDGKTVTEEKSVRLTAGQTVSLNFTDGEEQVQTAEETEKPTKLTVHLPADAKLYLAGKETKATGAVREFATTKLAPGAEWATYTIRAVVSRDGQEQVRERTISIAAGESRDLTIDFDATEVADASAR